MGSIRLHMIASHVVNSNTHLEEEDFDSDTDLGLSPGHIHMRDLILWEFYISISIYEYVIIVRNILKVHEGHYG